MVSRCDYWGSGYRLRRWSCSSPRGRCSRFGPGPSMGCTARVPFYILLAGAILNVLGFGPQNLLAAHEQSGVVARFRLLELLPHLAITYGLVAAFGIIGAAIAWSLRFVAELIGFSLITWRLTRMLPRGLFSGGRRHGVAILDSDCPAEHSICLRFVRCTGVRVAIAAAAIHSAYVWRSVLSTAERRRVTESDHGFCPHSRHEPTVYSKMPVGRQESPQSGVSRLAPQSGEGVIFSDEAYWRMPQARKMLLRGYGLRYRQTRDKPRQRAKGFVTTRVPTTPRLLSRRQGGPRCRSRTRRSSSASSRHRPLSA